MSNGVTYYYVVTAVNAAGESPYSNEVSTTPRTVPSPPVNLVAVPSDSQVSLSWQAPVDDGGSAITGYRVYRKTGSSSYSLLATVVTLAYTDGSVSNGVTYSYVVTAVNAAGESPYSNEVSTTPIAVPSPPVNLVAVPSDGQMSLSWQAPVDDGGSAVTGYRVYRKTGSSSYSLLATVVTLAYTDGSVSNGVTYFYVVTAVNAAGESPYSNEVSATPGQEVVAPDAPTNLVAVPSDGQVSLSWQAPVDDGGSAVTGYRVYRKTGSSSYSLLATVVIPGYTDNSVSNGVTYYYVVTAVNDVGESPYSNEVSATPEQEVVAPDAPTELVAVPGDGQVSLSWQAPVDDGGSAVTGYRVYRKTGDSSYSLLTTIIALGYTDGSVSNGVTYYYIVTAVNSAGESPYSNEVSTTPRTVPSSPANLVAVPGDGQVSLSWLVPVSDGGSAITGYRVYRKTGSSSYSLLTTVVAPGYTDGSVSNSVTYYYVVTAVNAAGESPYSNEVTVTPEQEVVAPGAPVDLVAVPGDNQVSLSWQAPVDDGGSPVTEYVIYRGTTSGSWSFQGSTTSLGYIDTKVSAGHTYYYVVTAVNSAGESPYSNEVTATVSSATSSSETTTTTTTSVSFSSSPGFEFLGFLIAILIAVPVVNWKKKKKFP